MGRAWSHTRPREAKWSSGVATVFWVYFNNIFSRIHLHIITFTTEGHYIIRIGLPMLGNLGVPKKWFKRLDVMTMKAVGR